ncbi:hypothetical protein N7462_009705 [Penicillium macrosclerotiorum]|uniref:uncharacterized protein n=1 Tax=Penicillium macrosclerotiorum TaxID=303699 RepID=UPI002548A596|nr:uncharacterized protein N7462_009705 [Penicillium macrosclerotiorum]KAJ5674266.1 hypothetical protein N7462_009705 [Penicillium macrosclerotiorum]
MIYEILGVHPRITESLFMCRSDYVDIKYYRHHQLANYSSKKRSPLSIKMILKAVVIIHSHGVSHSDLALRQVFHDDDFHVRLGKFKPSQCPGPLALGYEKVSHDLS